ncbi:hypothetical protein BGZ54_007209 [Gamsiella multidivaricata]|nr:hypothetical protein BGZ54_007209 [Gamsiella multidivaricata]
MVYDGLCQQIAGLSLEPNKEHRVSVFLSNVKSAIESMLGTEIAKRWVCTNGFDFKPCSIAECALCGRTHESNDYLVRQEVSKRRVLSDIAGTCRTTLETLLKHVHPPLDTDKDQIMVIKRHRSQLAKGVAYVQKDTNIKIILLFYRTLYIDEAIESRLDQNPNALTVKNGAIGLQTG